MSCVTMRKVASIWALRSTISWFRYATRTGSRPESGSSNRMYSGSSTSARADRRACAYRRRSRRGACPRRPADRQSRASPGRRADLGFPLLRVLAQREGDVVVEVHRAEQRAVLEKDAEQFADLVELVLAGPEEVGVLDEDGALFGSSRPTSDFRNTDLPVPDGPSRREISPGGQRQRDVAPDVLTAEGLGRPSTSTATPTTACPSAPAAMPVPAPVASTSPGSVRRRKLVRIRDAHEPLLLTSNDDAGDRLRASPGYRDPAHHYAPPESVLRLVGVHNRGRSPEGERPLLTSGGAVPGQAGEGVT